MILRQLRIPLWSIAVPLILAAFGSTCASAQELRGTIKRIDRQANKVVVEPRGSHSNVVIRLTDDASFLRDDGEPISLGSLKRGQHVKIRSATIASRVEIEPTLPERPFLEEFWHNFTHNLFKPLLLFFYLGFLVPILRIKFEFPYVIYQGLTIYLLLAIGWHGGEELAELDKSQLGGVFGFMGFGFLMNLAIGLMAYVFLSLLTRMRRVDKATVAGYYGSDSAGTFVTALGVLFTVGVAFDPYMPVMLAVMEIPGCLVALYLVARLRHQGMDPAGFMPDEPGYDPNARPALASGLGDNGHDQAGNGSGVEEEQPNARTVEAIEEERELSLEKRSQPTRYGRAPSKPFSPKLLHEVFLNPGLYLLFGGIVIGFVSRLQGAEVTRDDDNFFVALFQGVLCLFLLEMGMTASRKLRDLKSGGLGFMAFGLLAPPIFATMGILGAHAFSSITHTPFQEGTYVLFSVLCAAASYIAVPAVQRLAIPEASPTLPLAASLGLTFTFNVTVGIPLYLQIARTVMRMWPV